MVGHLDQKQLAPLEEQVRVPVPLPPEDIATPLMSLLNVADIQGLRLQRREEEGGESLLAQPGARGLRQEAPLQIT